MDKILSEMERQRRAESIYYTRRNNNYDYEDDKKGNNIYKRLFQFILFINVVLIIFGIQNKDYVFKEQFVSDVNTLIENIKQRANVAPEEIFENVVLTENIVLDKNKNDLNNEQNNKENNIQDITNSELIVEKVKEKTPEEIEIENLIGMYQFKNPLDNKGIITSRFGERSSDNENVSEYHTGIDIGIEYGTDVKSSVTGIVTLVSNVGDYGKQIRVRNNNVTTLYAHCSEIFVKEGDIVADGQVIGKVGNTGKSTGPHLHFEIRVDDRCLDPEKLVKF